MTGIIVGDVYVVYCVDCIKKRDTSDSSSHFWCFVHSIIDFGTIYNISFLSLVYVYRNVLGGPRTITGGYSLSLDTPKSPTEKISR